MAQTKQDTGAKAADETKQDTGAKAKNPVTVLLLSRHEIDGRIVEKGERLTNYIGTISSNMKVINE